MLFKIHEKDNFYTLMRYLQKTLKQNHTWLVFKECSFVKEMVLESFLLFNRSQVGWKHGLGKGGRWGLGRLVLKIW